MTSTQHYPLWEFLVPPGQYGRADRQTVGARGTRLHFADGTTVLDATSGLWNVNLGYGDPVIGQAIADAVQDASYLSLFRYSHAYARQAAGRLIEAAGPSVYRRVTFSTSGGAANDLAMKIARHTAVLRGEGRRRMIVALKGSYHGLTYGAHSLGGEPLGQQLYGVDMRHVRHVDPADPQELEHLMQRHGTRVAALVCEPVLGSGAHPLPSGFLRTAQRLRREYGFMLIADEVATGFGRTGPMFASSHWVEPPDLLLASKGLTNGTCAASVVLVAHHIAATFEEHDAVLVHAETQAGTPATCAAINATLDQFSRLDALTAGKRTAEALDAILDDLSAHLPFISHTTGTGCFRGVHLRAPGRIPADPTVVRTAVDTVRAHGALTHPGPGCIQLVPPLTCTEQDLDQLHHALLNGLAETGRGEGFR
ncbi:daptide-type RiPP biosynthesis aminotransferase [Streptomyces chrestomyceticus]|uniref:daptide-type RiPP biosynthesis aminotransferase n=1 Tax=Streptomyces chrestomyceticus TaxID=68185 RepID=UPI0035A8C05A